MTTDARERGERTARVHEIFDRVEKQIVELSKELDLVTDIVSLEAIESKYSALREGFTNQKRKTETLDRRRPHLIAELNALDSRIISTRALFPDKRPRRYSNGVLLSLVFIVPS